MNSINDNKQIFFEIIVNVILIVCTIYISTNCKLIFILLYFILSLHINNTHNDTTMTLTFSIFNRSCLNSKTVSRDTHFILLFFKQTKYNQNYDCHQTQSILIQCVTFLRLQIIFECLQYYWKQINEIGVMQTRIQTIDQVLKIKIHIVNFELEKKMTQQTFRLCSSYLLLLMMKVHIM